MRTLLTILLAVASIAHDGYCTKYPSGADDALKLYKECKDELKILLGNVSDDEVKLAFAIVAPEASQYNRLTDYFEVRAVRSGYPSKGAPNYSIGVFQMKPSFAENLEKEVAGNARLKKKYGKRLAYKAKDATAKRRELVDRLADRGWQLVYVAAFYDVVKLRTASWKLRGNEEKLRYWATLYNAGFYLSKPRSKQRQSVRQFPRGTNEFNYSAAAVDIYQNKLKGSK